MNTLEVRAPSGHVRLLDEIEALAWAKYLRVTQTNHTDSYEDLEAWAWQRLQTSLTTVKVRRAAIRRDADARVGTAGTTHPDGTVDVDLG